MSDEEMPIAPPPVSEELIATLKWLEIERVRICTAYLNGDIDEDWTQYGYPKTWRERKHERD